MAHELLPLAVNSTNAPTSRAGRWRVDAISGLALLTAAVSVALMTALIWTPYSYWLDEVASVAMSFQSIEGVFNTMLNEVQPPLYQLVLKFWIDLLGPFEFATRSLSWLCALAAVAFFWHGTRFLPPRARVAGLVFFATHPLLAFYAQETRPYAMLLLLATLITLIVRSRSVQLRQLPLLLALCLGLSLTHYFGLVFACVVLLLTMIDMRRKPLGAAAVLLTGIALLVWPAIHILHGTLASKLGGNFVVRIDGPVQTLQTAYGSLLALPGYAATRFNLQGVGIGALLLLSAIAIACAIGISRKPLFPGETSVAARLGLLSGAFVLLVAAIDHHTPISTPRNYIVLLPAAALLFALAFHRVAAYLRLSLSAGLIVLLAFGAMNLYVGSTRLSDKRLPLENWRDAGLHASRIASQRIPVYYETSLLKSFGPLPIFEKTFGFYISWFSGHEVRPQPLDIDIAVKAGGPFIVLLGHASESQVAQIRQKLDQAYLLSEYLPPQRVRYGAGVILATPRAAGTGQNGGT